MAEESNSKVLRDPVVQIREIFLTFTTYESQPNETVGFDFAMTSWMGTTDFKKVRLSSSHFMFKHDELTCELAGYDDNILNFVPLRTVAFEVNLKSSVNGVLANFDVKFFNVRVGVNEKKMSVKNDAMVEIATILMKIELLGEVSSPEMEDYPFFGTRAADEIHLSTNSLGPYKQTSAISHGKVGINRKGYIYGGIPGQSFQPNQTAVAVTQVIIHHQTPPEAPRLTFRKPFEEVEVPPPPRFSMKIDVNVMLGMNCSLIVHDGSRQLFELSSDYVNNTNTFNSAGALVTTTGIQGEGTGEGGERGGERGGVGDGGNVTGTGSTSVSRSWRYSKHSLEVDNVVDGSVVYICLVRDAGSSTQTYLDRDNMQLYDTFSAAELRFVEVTVSQKPQRKIPRQLFLNNKKGAAAAAAKKSPSESLKSSLQSMKSSSGKGTKAGQATDMSATNKSKKLVCRLWKPVDSTAPHLQRGMTSEERKLKTFQLFHRRLSYFISSEYGKHCGEEFEKRVQADACVSCRARYKEVCRDRPISPSATGKLCLSSSTALVSPTTGTGALPSSPSSSFDSNVVFPLFCWNEDCVKKIIDIYQTRKHIESLTEGLVGEGAGWVLPKQRRHFDEAWWKERERGLNQQRKVLLYEYKKSLYDRPWVEKWVCPICGIEKPYSEDEEDRREEERDRVIAMMLGESVVEEESEDDVGHNWTTIKMKKEVWCVKCKEEYRPRVVWRERVWTSRMHRMEEKRKQEIDALTKQISKESLQKYLDSLPPKRKVRPQSSSSSRRRAIEGGGLGDGNLLDFAFKGSAFKFSDTSNMGGSMWERLVKSAQLSFINESLRISDDLDGIGESYCLDVQQAGVVCALMEWDVGKSSSGLTFVMDPSAQYLSVVHNYISLDPQAALTTATAASPAATSTGGGSTQTFLSFATMHELRAREALPLSIAYLSFSAEEIDSSMDREALQHTNTSGAIADILHREGSISDDSLSKAYSISHDIPYILQIHLLLMDSIPLAQTLADKRAGLSSGDSSSSAATVTGVGRFSFGVLSVSQQQIAYQSHPSSKSSTAIAHKFGTQQFSWGVVEEGPAAGGGGGGGGQGKYGTEQSTFSLYARGLRVYRIPPLRTGDSLRLLLDPFTGRLTLSIYYSKSSREHHHTFRVPSGTLDNYVLGCTLNHQQQVRLTKSVGADNLWIGVEQTEEDEVEAKQQEDVIADTTTGAAAADTSSPSQAPPAAAADKNEKSVSDQKGKADKSGIRKDPIEDDDVSLTQEITPFRVVNQLGPTGVIEGQKEKPRIRFNADGQSGGSSVMMGNKKDEMKELFNARRRQSTFGVDNKTFKYPALIDRVSSDAPWMIGVPGIFPDEILRGAGFLQNVPPVEESESGQRVSEDWLDTGGDKEVAVVRIEHSDSSGRRRWAVGCGLHGSSCRVECVWIDEHSDGWNYTHLISNNHNHVTCRVQYLVDSRVSRYRWAKGVASSVPRANSRATFTTNTPRSNCNSARREERFELPAKALRACKDYLQDWEVVHYVVRGIIDDNIWPGVYFLNQFRKSEEEGEGGSVGLGHEDYKESGGGQGLGQGQAQEQGREEERRDDREFKSVASDDEQPDVVRPAASPLLSTASSPHPSTSLSPALSASYASRPHSPLHSPLSPHITRTYTSTASPPTTATPPPPATSGATSVRVSSTTVSLPTEVLNKKMTASEFALFPYNGRIVEIHVSEVEFLCMK